MPVKTFYVCSFGGCGSKMLCKALEKFGNVVHIHCRNPPNELEYACNYYEIFNSIKIPENELANYYVIFIYRNPIKSILSRFDNPVHLIHIESAWNIKIEDVINTSSDLYEITEYYNNYTRCNIKRNYKMYCVKYEDIFNKQDELSKTLNIGELNLEKKETKREDMMHKYYDGLYKVYKDLIEIMNNNDFIIIN